MADLIEEGMAAGRVRPGDAYELARALNLMNANYLLETLGRDPGFDRRLAVDTLMAVGGPGAGAQGAGAEGPGGAAPVPRPVPAAPPPGPPGAAAELAVVRWAVAEERPPRRAA